MKLTEDVRKHIEALWMDPQFHGSFSGATTFKRALKSEGYNLSYPQVTSILYSIPAYIDRVRRLKLYKTRPFRVTGTNDTWQCDIAVMPQIKLFVGFLLCIDIFSLRVYTQPIAGHTKTNIKNAFAKIFKRNNNVSPHTMQSDQEFISQREYFNERNIYLRFIYGRNKAVMSELYIYKIKRRLYAAMEALHTKDWVALLPQVTLNENKTPKEALNGIKPIDIHSSLDDEWVNDKTPNRPRLIHWQDAMRHQKEYENDASKLQVGDMVLYDKVKKPFEKSFIPKVSSIRSVLVYHNFYSLESPALREKMVAMPFPLADTL